MITIEGSTRQVECPKNVSLLAALTAAGVFVESPCGGIGTCGKCLVKILAGSTPPPTGEETAFLGEEKLAAGYRLACLLYPEGDLHIELDPHHGKRRHKVLSEGLVREFAAAPSLRKVRCVSPRRGGGDNLPADRWLQEILGGRSEADLAFMQTLAPLKVGYTGGVRDVTVVLDGDRLLGVETGDTTGSLYGLAVDIGTTTMVASLVDVRAGVEIGRESAINPQTRQGLDVLSRIAFAQEKGEEGVALLGRAVIEELESMAGDLCREHDIQPRNIYSITVAANTTMCHLLLGLSPESMGLIPFAPTLTEGFACRAGELGFKALKSALVYTLPSVSAYIGADIVAGVYSCALSGAEENVLFVDIGTNGEVVLAGGGRLLSCSCAAGPAFEGMNIHAGMRAANGAIEDLSIHADAGGLRLRLKTIGDTDPAGLCGSGILAAIRELLKVGMIRPDGRLLKEKDLPPEDPRRNLCAEFNGKPAVRLSNRPHEVLITQKDVRQVQLAKGAILSAFRALVGQSGLDLDKLDRVLVAGQFGAYLPVASLTGCGIIPFELSDRIEYVGNTSKAGAYAALMSREARREMEKLAREIDYFELGTLEGYDRLFADSMKFPACGESAEEPCQCHA